MKSVLLVTSFFYICFFSINQTKKVEIWSDSNFEDNLNKTKNAFVKFFAPWCGHCKRLAPDWEKLAEELDEKYGKIVKVDCTDSGKETCAKYQVRGYPTLKYFKFDSDGSLGDKAIVDYDKSRHFDELYNFAKLHGSPVYIELQDDQVDKFMNDEQQTSYILFTSSKNTDAFKSFEKACREFLGQAKFGVSFSKDPKKLSKMADSNSLVFNRAKELISSIEKSTDSTNDHSLFESFIKTNLHGKVAMRTSSNDQTISRPLLTVFINANYKTNSSYFSMIRNRILKIAPKYEALQFSIAEMDQFRGYLYGIGYESNDHDLLYTIDDDKQQRFVPKITLKFDQVSDLQTKVVEFVEDYLQDKIPVFLKSEEIIENQDPSKPYILVAKSFVSDISQNDTDYFIKMYAPWCGHCKKLAPVWDELAELYKDVKDLRISKFDATANDIPLSDFEIQGFPTLFFVKRNELKPIPYEGARTKEALMKFIETHYTGSSLSKASKDEL